MSNNKEQNVVFDFQSYHTPLTRAMFIGVFLGFASAIVNIAYWSFYVSISELVFTSYIVNVQTIAFGSIIPVVVAGALYHTFTHYMKGAGAWLTSIIFALAAIWLIAVIANGDYGDTAKHITQGKELMIPIISVIGIASAIALPICYRSKKVEDMML